METTTLRKAFALLSLSGGLLLFSVGSVRGTPGPLPASSSILEDSIPRLGRVARSPDQLLRNAIARLKNRDTLGLILMSPNPEQLKDIYLKTPEGKNAGEAQVNFAREFYYMDNGKLMYRSLGKYGGKNLELLSWKATKPPVPVEGGGKILRAIEIQVKDWTANSEQRIFFVQSIYVDPQGCKIWGFEDNKGGKGVKD
ncbi:MAG TPA: hypothetical protein VJ385_04610 [Fibrobacteria bacterium]|nr:hypothetical protein [Fibrobacteria bacterium]